MLICSVRDCRMPLSRRERSFICERGHLFDVSRSGYLNLLQPQERRSKNPGDTLEAVAARRRLHDRGVTAHLFHAIAGLASATPTDVALDVGCGDGFYLGKLAEASRFSGHGVDISIPAIDSAARRYPHCQWIVANADRMIPWDNHSFSLILSITARMNPPEFRRVLRDDGRLLVALPAPDDLIELRGTGRDRMERTLTEFENDFELTTQHRVSASVELDAPAVHDVLHSIYRPLQREEPAAMRVTFSFDLLLFKKRGKSN